MSFIKKINKISNSILRMINEQDDDDEYYRITPEELIRVLELGSYSSGVLKPRNFDGKKIVVLGNLDLSGKPIKSLGNIARIEGRLDISHTNIPTIGDIIIKGDVYDFGSERQRIRQRREELAKLSDADDRRQDGEWDLTNPDIDDEGLAANALFDHLVSNNDLTKIDEDTKAELESKKERLVELQERYEDIDGTLEPEEVSTLADEISDLEDEIEELQSNFADVYYIIPKKYMAYSTLYIFEVVGLRDQSYYVGTYDDAYDAAIENQLELIDDVGIDSLSASLIEDNIDKDGVRDYIRDFYESDISENPEVYFNSDDFELTDEQEERKEELENYINEMEDLKSEKEDQRDEYEHNSDEYNELDEQIQEIESNIETAQDELDSIEPDTEPTDDMIQDKVNYYVRNTDEIEWLKEMGYNLSDWVNLKGVATDIVDSDGIEVLASYDGRYNEQRVTTIDGKVSVFVVMRVD